MPCKRMSPRQNTVVFSYFFACAKKTINQQFHPFSRSNFLQTCEKNKTTSSTGPQCRTMWSRYRFFSTFSPPPLFKENVSMHKHLNNTMPCLSYIVCLKCRPPHKVPDYVRRLPEKKRIISSTVNRLTAPAEAAAEEMPEWEGDYKILSNRSIL